MFTQTLSLAPSLPILTRQYPSYQADSSFRYSPTLPPICQLTLNVIKPRPSAHLAANLYGQTVAQKSIFVPTHLHLTTCSPQTLSLSLPLLTRQCPSYQADSPSCYSPTLHLPSADLKRHKATPVHASRNQFIWLDSYAKVQFRPASPDLESRSRFLSLSLPPSLSLSLFLFSSDSFQHIRFTITVLPYPVKYLSADLKRH